MFGLGKVRAVKWREKKTANLGANKYIFYKKLVTLICCEISSENSRYVSEKKRKNRQRKGLRRRKKADLKVH